MKRVYGQKLGSPFDHWFDVPRDTLRMIVEGSPQTLSSPWLRDPDEPGWEDRLPLIPSLGAPTYLQPIKTPRHQKADAIEGTYCQLAISYGDRARRCGMGKVRISGRSLMNEHFTYA